MNGELHFGTLWRTLCSVGLWRFLAISCAFAVLLGAPSFGQDQNASPNQPAEATPNANNADPNADMTDPNMQVPLKGQSNLPQQSKNVDIAETAAMAAWLGIITVLILLFVFKFHAFLALIIGAIVVSLFIPGVGAEYITRVTSQFGEYAALIGISVAMAVIIGRCMHESGSADRIVQGIQSVLGRRSALALMICSFIFSIPAYFETVFYLLVPLARSMYQRTKQNYLLYLLAIVAGSCVTHTLIPPSPGPLFVSTILGVNIGTMMFVGICVGVPAAIVAYLFASFYNDSMPIDVKSVADIPAPESRHFVRSPSFLLAILPILLPIVLISISKYVTSKADAELAHLFRLESDVEFWKLSDLLHEQTQDAAPTPGNRLKSNPYMTPETWELLLRGRNLTIEERRLGREGLNKVLVDRNFYDRESFHTPAMLRPEVEEFGRADRTRMSLATIVKFNRELLRESLPYSFGAPPDDTPTRRWANFLEYYGNVNIALILAALIALLVVRLNVGKNMFHLSGIVEQALTHGAIIVLMAAAGGAFGEMLRGAGIPIWAEEHFGITKGNGIFLLFACYIFAAVLKFAQGSTTTAMVLTAVMIAAVIGNTTLSYNKVYVALAIGSGSLMGSWMNDSSFWIFTRLAELTEIQSLRTYTVTLAVLSVISFIATVILSVAMPLL